MIFLYLSRAVNWDGHTETIISKKIKHPTPKSGWADFAKRILGLQIVTLPDQYKLHDPFGAEDGRTFNVEIATKNQYRFYSYYEPHSFQDRYWQDKSMSDILVLFQTELGVE